MQAQVVDRRNTVILSCLVELATAATLTVLKNNGLDMDGGRNRQVIAEGVETAEHGDSLLNLGCALAQGYGIARPMSGDAFLEWAKAWKKTHGDQA